MTNFEVFSTVQKIADLAFELWSPNIRNSIWLIDQRSATANPIYNVTERGIFLELVSFLPESLHTPWGEWNPWGEGVSNQNFLEAFKGKMKLKFFQPTSQGIIYEVLEFRGFQLPEPELKEKYDPDFLKNQWNKFKKRYEATV